MTGDELFKQLNNNQNYNRWGCNNQPSVYLTVAILEILPVKWIAYHQADSLQIVMHRDLTISEHWNIEKLTPDEITADRESWQYNLWWD